MVSFICDICQETLKKPKLDNHFRRCPDAIFSCVDCSTTFTGTDYRAHTSCISEAEKYQKSLYKPTAKQAKKQEGQSARADSETAHKAEPQPLKKDDEIGGVEKDSILAKLKRVAYKRLAKAQRKGNRVTLDQLMQESVAKFGCETELERKRVQSLLIKSLTFTPVSLCKEKSECTALVSIL